MTVIDDLIAHIDANWNAVITSKPIFYNGHKEVPKVFQKNYIYFYNTDNIFEDTTSNGTKRNEFYKIVAKCASAHNQAKRDLMLNELARCLNIRMTGYSYNKMVGFKHADTSKEWISNVRFEAHSLNVNKEDALNVSPTPPPVEGDITISTDFSIEDGNEDVIFKIMDITGVPNDGDLLLWDVGAGCLKYADNDPYTHVHDGSILELDGIDSDGGDFDFTVAGALNLKTDGGTGSYLKHYKDGSTVRLKIMGTQDLYLETDQDTIGLVLFEELGKMFIFNWDKPSDAASILAWGTLSIASLNALTIAPTNDLILDPDDDLLITCDLVDYTGQLIKMNDNHISSNNRAWFQIFNKDGQKRFEIGSIANGNPEIRFNVVGDTRIGFPASDPTYFAFLNSYSDMWLGNNADRTMYFNYYNGTGLYFGMGSNYQSVDFFITKFELKSSGGADLIFGNDINMTFKTGNGTKIGTFTDQKFAFWNATPVVQQVLATGGGATVDNVISLLQTLGLCRQV